MLSLWWWGSVHGHLHALALGSANIQGMLGWAVQVPPSCAWVRGRFEAHDSGLFPHLCFTGTTGSPGGQFCLSKENLLAVGAEGEERRSSMWVTACTLLQEQS